MLHKVKKIYKILIAGFLLFALIGGAIVWYIFNDTFTNTNQRKSVYVVNSNDFIKEFQVNDSLANLKYTEKIITVNGLVAEIEPVDSVVNIKMIDTATDAYINFSFQETSMAEAKALQEGQIVSIKGSCSGGVYSEILETNFISFKRCAINK